MFDLETAKSVEDALRVANRAGGPVQNLMVADADGHIGWSLMGQVPVRASYDSTLPHSWREPGGGWTGWRTPEEYPRVIDPASGRLWTANARTLDTETWLAFMGDGGYDLGARAAQIRDDLFALPIATAADMTNIQLDDRALFLTRWRDLLLDLLPESQVRMNPLRAQARDLIEHWSGRAAVDDAGYRIVRAARAQIRKDVYESLTALARQRYPSTKFTPSAQFEGPLWQLVTQRPRHLLDPRYESWEAALLGSLDRSLASLQEDCKELRRCTWGKGNVLQMRHPLSSALPFASHWLDMPAQELPGDAQMPRVQGAAFGASQRLVVSPGREAQGSLQMPGGPVDHPLSPFYGAGHEAWARGEPTPLLPGAAKHTLTLRPAAVDSK
jgi:penicillin amidase